AADARELRHPMRFEVRLEGGLNDAGGDGVVSAAGAQRGLGAVVVGARETDPVASVRSGCFHGHRVTPSAMRAVVLPAPAPSCARISVVTKPAGIGRPVKCRTERSLLACSGFSARSRSAI